MLMEIRITIRTFPRDEKKIWQLQRPIKKQTSLLHIWTHIKHHNCVCLYFFSFQNVILYQWTHQSQKNRHISLYVYYTHFLKKSNNITILIHLCMSGFFPHFFPVFISCTWVCVCVWKIRLFHFISCFIFLCVSVCLYRTLRMNLSCLYNRDNMRI